MDLKKGIKNTVRVCITAAVMIAFTVGLFAQAPRAGFRDKDMRQGKGMRQGRGMMGAGVSILYRAIKTNRDELNISDSQFEKIEAIVLDFEETKVKTENEMNTRQLEMKKLMMAEQKDYKKIKAVLTGISSARHDMVISGMKAGDNIRTILTPEQQDALKKLAGEKMRGSRSSRRGERGPGGRRPPKSS